MISALSNPEHGRMWQQMNQLQNPYRQQQSGDLAASQMNHQASLRLRAFFLAAFLLFGKFICLAWMSYA